VVQVWVWPKHPLDQTEPNFSYTITSSKNLQYIFGGIEDVHEDLISLVG
jgi:hypothetical protein